eukprot:UN10036
MPLYVYTIKLKNFQFWIWKLINFETIIKFQFHDRL